MPGTLYRLLDADGDALYIGASATAAQRLSQHEGDKEWWPEVVRATFTHFETRDEAFDAERSLLANGEGGKHNKAGARRYLTEAEKRERQEERDRRTKETHERWEQEYQPGESVICSNCGEKPFRLQKGQLISEADCPTCGCQTLELREPVQ